MNDKCNAIHRSIVEQFKTAIVYGKSVKHQPQRVGLAHELADEDIGIITRQFPIALALSWILISSLISHDRQEMSGQTQKSG